MNFRLLKWAVPISTFFALVLPNHVFSKNSKCDSAIAIIASDRTKKPTNLLASESNLIFEKIQKEIPELNSKKSSHKPGEVGRPPSSADIKKLIRSLLLVEKTEPPLSVERLQQLTAQVIRWTRQSYELAGAEAHQLADRPRIDILAKMQPWKETLNDTERYYFDLAAPRLSRYIWSRALWAANGDKALEREIQKYLFESSKDSFLVAVSKASRSTKTKAASKESSEKYAVEQIVGKIKQKIPLTDQEKARMSEKFEGRTLIENVKNIALSENGGALRRYVQYDFYTAFLGRDPETRVANLLSLIDEALIRVIRYYPFDIESPRANTAYKSHFADQVASFVKNMIIRRSDNFIKTSKKEGVSLDAPLRKNSEDSRTRGERIGSADQNLSSLWAESNTFVDLEDQLLSNPVRWRGDQLKSLWIIAQSIRSDGSSTTLSSHLGQTYRAWLKNALHGLKKLKINPDPDVSNPIALRETETEYLAEKLVSHTPIKGDQDKIVDLAKQYLNFLTPEEYETLRKFLLNIPSYSDAKPNSVGLKIPESIKEILEVWTEDIERQDPFTKWFVDPKVMPVIRDPVAPALSDQESRQLNILFNLPKGTKINLRQLAKDYRESHFTDVETHLWVTSVLLGKADELYRALPPLKKIELDEALDRFLKGMQEAAKARGKDLDLPKPWWKKS